MRKAILTGVAAVSLFAGVSSCSDTFDPTSDREGRIVLDINVSHDVAAPSKASQAAKSRAAAVHEITVEDLKLALRSNAGGQEFTWPSIADFDPSQDFPVGAYTFEASYGTKGEEGFDKPYYFGSTQVSIRENETTPVSLTAKLANAMVSVVYTEAFTGYFTSYATDLQTSSGNTISFEAGEDEAAYVNAGHIEVFANITKPNGLSAKLSAASFDAEARHHYIVKMDVDAGSGTLSITFDSDLVSETIDLDITDQVLMAPAPTLVAEGFADGTPITLIEGSHASVDKISIVATAYGDVAAGVLTTVSDALNAKQWPATVDFSTADTQTLALLKSLGVKELGLTGVKSQMAVLDLTDVLPQINYVADGNNTTTFTFFVKDKYSKVSDELTLTVIVDKLQMSIVSVEPLGVDDDVVTFELEYNGDNIDEALNVQIKNARGTWDNATIKSITPKGDGTYTVVIAAPDNNTIEFRCVSGAVVTEPVKVSRKGIAVDDRDVFATYAIGTLYFDSSMDALTAMAATDFYISTDDSEYSKVDVVADGASFKLTELNPGTTYYVKAYIDERYSKTVTFTTEEKLQLPNADMETWSVADSGNNWQLEVPGDSDSPWGTNNPLTTSQGSNVAYCRISGTVQSTDGHTGNAAMLRTIGWGSGNTASGSVTTGVMKYSDAGLLHLGSSRTIRPDGYGDREGSLETDDLDCGLEFASRPASISFWYKYEPRNSADAGVVDVWVMDAEGNKLATGTTTLTQREYTQVTLPLEYGKSASKAAKIYVRFLSTNDRTFLAKNSSNFTAPPFANLSNGKYEGSKLYIDDIELNY